MVAAHIVAVLVILLLPLPLSAALPCSSLSSAADCRRNGKLLPTPGLFYKKTENTTDGVFQVITFSRLKNRVGGYNRAVPSFGYVGRVYGVAGGPNHAKLQLAAGLRRGHRSRQAAQDCGVIHCAGLPPPLCGAVTSPLSRDESA